MRLKDIHRTALTKIKFKKKTDDNSTYNKTYICMYVYKHSSECG